MLEKGSCLVAFCLVHCYYFILEPLNQGDRVVDVDPLFDDPYNCDIYTVLYQLKFLE